MVLGFLCPDEEEVWLAVFDAPVAEAVAFEVTPALGLVPFIYFKLLLLIYPTQIEISLRYYYKM